MDQGITAAMVAVEPSTGAVRALVGGPGFDHYQYDIATQAPGRQTGSSFKTFTLLTAARLILEDKTAKLQGWAIVDNTVGQDWENVQLSLVAGRLAGSQPSSVGSIEGLVATSESSRAVKIRVPTGSKSSSVSRASFRE